MNNLIIRQATLNDAKVLLEWRNDPVTRHFRNDPRIITIEEHLLWLKKRQSSDNKIYIFEDRGIAVGNICVDVSARGVELGWIVAPNYRGNGIANKMVELVKERFPDSTIFWAKIRFDNVASIKVAKKAGLIWSKKEGDMVYFIKDC